jgi:uncharacterized Zn-binding protein involved in type VI secretion
MPPQGRVGDKSQVPADAHGCLSCPHPCIGPATSGSPDVNVNGRPALRVTDPGVHTMCCGPNKWTASGGSGTVFINNLPAHRQTDEVIHCGGMGHLIEGSNNVITGD